MKRIVLIFIVCASTVVSQQTDSKKVFFLIGPPGSGKTSASEVIKNRNSDLIAYYSAGNLLRVDAQKDTEEGRMIKDILARAAIVPLSVGMGLAERALLSSETPIVIFDGFLPTFDYVIAFEEFLKKQKAITFVATIEIAVAKSVAEDRVLKRSRADDLRDVFEKRYQRYVQNRPGIVEWYQKHYKFYSLDSDNSSLEEVSKNIETLIKASL